MLSDPKIKVADLPVLDDDERDDACFRGRDRAWSALVGLYDHYHRSQGLSYEKLAKRISRTRSQVQRWLSSPFNMNLKSFGLLAEGLDADLVIEVVPRLPERQGSNQCHPRDEAYALQVSRAQTFGGVYIAQPKSLSSNGAVYINEPANSVRLGQPAREMA